MKFSVNDLRELAGVFNALATSADDVAVFCSEAVVVSLDGSLLRIEGSIADGPLALMAGQGAAVIPPLAPPIDKPKRVKRAFEKIAPRQVSWTAEEDDQLVAWMIEHPGKSTYHCGLAMSPDMGRSVRAIDMHMKKVLSDRIARERAAVASALATQKAVAVLSAVDEVSAAPASAAEVAAVGAGDAPAAVGPDVVADAVPVAVPVVQKVLAPVAPVVPTGCPSDEDDLQILTRLGRGEKTPMVAADMGMDTAYVGSRFVALLAPFRDEGYGPVDAQRKAIERLSARVRR